MVSIGFGNNDWFNMEDTHTSIIGFFNIKTLLLLLLLLLLFDFFFNQKMFSVLRLITYLG
jgi:hypothetical protein